MKKIESLIKLKEEILNCPQDKICFGEYNQIRVLLGRRANKNSNEKIKIMFIGEGPKGKFEPDVNFSNGAYRRDSKNNITDSKGEVFGSYSRTGERFFRMLKQINFSNKTIDNYSWLTNCIKCSQIEKERLGNPGYCIKLLENEIEIIDPEILILVGAEARDILKKITQKNIVNYEILEITIGKQRKIISCQHFAYIPNNDIVLLIEKINEMLNSKEKEIRIIDI